VLIAAAFFMYNRYVDGLATWAPRNVPEIYRQSGKRLAEQGYISSTDGLPTRRGIGRTQRDADGLGPDCSEVFTESVSDVLCQL
jgi:hypothetical protein